MVDTEPPGELGDPGPDRLVLAQPVEVLVHAGKHLLEHILGVVLGQPEALNGDGVHIPREAVDELTPRLFLTRAAAGHEAGVGDLREGHGGSGIKSQ